MDVSSLVAASRKPGVLHRSIPALNGESVNCPEGQSDTPFFP